MSIPRDIPLPLPAPSWLLQVLVVASFLVHIVFVNLMVGGALLVFVNQIRGLKRPVYDRLAHVWAETITVNKSVAVVMGVGPLLVMGVLYTVQFYTANILTGTSWMLVAPLIALTFLLLYLHKFSWKRMAAHRHLHVALAGVNVLLLLFIPLVFLANANLALFPDAWTEIRGFASALGVPGVWSRYLHFLAASVAVTSLFGVYLFGRKKAPQEGLGEGLGRAELKRTHYSLALFVTCLQFLFGPLLLVSLPSQGVTAALLILLGGGIAFALPAIVLMWREIDRPRVSLGARFPLICILLSVVVLFMGTARHVYREAALATHKAQVAARTAHHAALVRQAYRESRRAGHPVAGDPPAAAGGADEAEARFKMFCGTCHASNEKKVGPSLVEIASIYSGKPEGIVSWAKAPGKKRPDYPQMPAFGGIVADQDLVNIARYILKAGAGSLDR